MRLRIGVIGLGYFGGRHARADADHPTAELIGGADIDGVCVTELAATGATGYGSFRDLLAQPELHAVSICLPDSRHEEAAIAAAEAGKAILLEKPLAYDAPAARRIVEAVERNGVRLMIGHILRFDPPGYAQVHDAADPARLGAPIHNRAKRNGVRSTARRLGAASSILFYMGAHDVNAKQWIGRFRITRVDARKREVLGTGNEDAIYAVLDFENGAIGSLDYSSAWPDGLMNGFRAAFQIVGTKTAAALDASDQGLYFTDDAAATGGDTHLWLEINGRIGGGLADELDHFVKATVSGAPHLQHYREAYDAMPVLDALSESARIEQPGTSDDDWVFRDG